MFQPKVRKARSGLGFGGLKIKCNENKSKTVKERIISFASVEYVIVFGFFFKRRKEK